MEGEGVQDTQGGQVELHVLCYVQNWREGSSWGIVYAEKEAKLMLRCMQFNGKKWIRKWRYIHTRPL